jgi:predicted DNA-binding protein (MmcQ/YjbR family)
VTLKEVEDYILSHCEALSDHSFEEDPTVTIFRRADNNQRFAATKNVGRRSVDAGQSGRIDILNVSLEPRLVTSLREREGFRPAWRMNRNRWVTILVNGSVPDDEIRSYIDMAYKTGGKKGGKRSGRG